MIAVDTNVVVRLLVADDAAQARRATALFERGPVFIPVTVLLETEWVLRGAYALERTQINRLLHLLLGLPGVEMAEPEAVMRALERHAEGLDFADALHLALAGDAESFATFDRRLLRASKVGGLPIVAP
ncbi:MAG: type II toxin-antitoxin system VapC family toxin [Burkholderiales bacterium]|jgi:predicted nucleic-acid-binding protein|nr:type II toxin-antitoxin system VapC family toxin [Burkholderiales bacterium]